MPRGRFVDYAEPPERPADPAVRRANLRRIVRLFVPYKLRLSAVLALIVFSAALGVDPRVPAARPPERDRRLGHVADLVPRRRG